MAYKIQNFCLITTFKENYALLAPLVNFYKNFYGFSNFLFFCGLPSGKNHFDLIKIMSKKLGQEFQFFFVNSVTNCGLSLKVSQLKFENINLNVVSYPAKDLISEIDFHNLKFQLFQWAYTFLNNFISRVLVIDSDEFLKAVDPEILCKEKQMDFHFLEYCPATDWPPANLFFSLQGWYYKRQSNFHFKYAGFFAYRFLRFFGLGLNHSGCKTYYFEKSNLLNANAWHHGTSNNFACKNLNAVLCRVDLCEKILKQANVCYHLAILSKAIFMNEKLPLFARLQTDINKGQKNDFGISKEHQSDSAANSTYEKFYSRSIFPVIQDNFLLPFIKPGGILLFWIFLYGF